MKTRGDTTGMGQPRTRTRPLVGWVGGGALLAAGLFLGACSDDAEDAEPGRLSWTCDERNPACSDNNRAVEDAVSRQALQITTIGEDEGVRFEGPGAVVEIQPRPDLGLTEVFVESRDGSGSSRVLVDPATGSVVFIGDPVTGRRTYFVDDTSAPDPNRMVFTYRRDGSLEAAWILYAAGGEAHVGRLSGRPAFSGQLTGQLFDANTLVGSYTVVSSNGMVGSQATETIETSFGAVVVSEVQVVSDGQRALGEVYDGPAQLPPVVGFPVLAVVGFPDVLQRGGTVLAVGGLAFGAPAYATAGVAMAIAGLVSNDVGSFIEQNFGTDEPVAGPAVDLLVDVLSNGSGGLLSRFQQVADAIDEARGTAEDFVDRSRSALRQRVETFSDGVANTTSVVTTIPDAARELIEELAGGLNGVAQAAAEMLDSAVSEADSIVEGVAAFGDGAVLSLNGTVSFSGNVSLQGSSPFGDQVTINGQFDVNGTVSGSFGRSGPGGQSSGNTTGGSQPTGDCQVSQGSGGQGTFANAHVVGFGPGQVDFSYQAFSIPDQFQVASANQVYFDTGALISGGTTVSLPVAEPGRVILFVTVTAPRSGTAWNYSIGCIE